MGGTQTREAEVSHRLVDSLETGHLHTAQLLLKFIQHTPGGDPKNQLQKGSPNPFAASTTNYGPSTSLALSADAKPRRPPPTPVTDTLDEATAAFHARAATLAQQQALAAGLNSASFPIPIDLDTLFLKNGDSLLVAAVKQDQPTIVKLLCETGLDIDYADSKGFTALHHAVLANRIGCLNTLLQQYAFSLIHSKDGLLPSQCTPHAQMKRHLEAAEQEDEVKLLTQLLAASPADPPSTHPVFEISSSYSFPFHLYRMECASEILCSPTVGCQTEVFFRGPNVRNASDCICLYYVDDVNQPHVMRPRVGSVFYLTERRTNTVTPPSMRQSSSASSSSSVSSSSSSPSANGVRALGWDSITVTLKGLPISAYRFVYFDSQRQQAMAATDVFRLISGPTSPTAASAGTSSATPSAAGSSSRQRSASAATPVTSASATNSSTSASIFSYLPTILSPSTWIGSGSGSTSTSAAPTPVALHPSFLTLTNSTPAQLEKFSHPPPTYFTTHFRLNMSAVELALQLDPKLARFCTSLVPKQMKQEEFWCRYFWLMSRLSEEEVTEYPKPAIAPETTVTTTASTPSQPTSVTTAPPIHQPPASVTTIIANSLPLAAPTSSYQPPNPVASPIVTTTTAMSPPSLTAAAPIDITNSAVTNVPAAAVSPSSTIVKSPPPPPPTLQIQSPVLSTTGVTSPTTGSRKSTAIPQDEDEDDSSSYVPPSFSALPASHT